jgi:prepilin-type N-terminal cleavage/methylation domain-containing protein
MDTKKIESKKQVRNEGFTLIEILVVIGMIALLAAIVLIAINPARQFAQGRNTQRTSNVETILNAVGQNLADNKGIFTCPGATIDATKRTICEGTGCGTLAAGVITDLSCLVPTYISANLPLDPNGGVWTSDSNYNTKYTIEVDTLGRYKVCAPNSIEAALGSPAEICIIR